MGENILSDNALSHKAYSFKQFLGCYIFNLSEEIDTIKVKLLKTIFQDQSTGFFRYTFAFIINLSHRDIVFRLTVFSVYGKKSYRSDRHSISLNNGIIPSLLTLMVVKPTFSTHNGNRNIIMEKLIILWIVNPFDFLWNISPLKLSYIYFHFSPRPIYRL